VPTVIVERVPTSSELAGAMSALAEGMPRLSVISVALVALVTFLGANRPVFEERTYGMKSVDLMDRFVPAGRDVGRALRDAVPPDTRISTTLAGTVPYFSKLYAIDEWGLNDKTIARIPSKPIPLNGRGHLKRSPASYLDAQGVNLELGHPELCDCASLCDAPFPQVYLHLDDKRCVRMRYRVKTPALTKRFCTDKRFIPLHVDCKSERIDFEWKEETPAMAAVALPELRSSPVRPEILLGFKHGVSFGKTASVKALVDQTTLLDVEGPVLNSFHGGDASTGWISYPLAKEVRRVTALVGGGNDCTTTFIGLVSKGRVIARACGKQDERLRPVTLDVPPGSEPVSFVAVDMAEGGWGHVMFSNVELWTASVTEPEQP
jgi:hypothetical protein